MLFRFICRDNIQQILQIRKKSLRTSDCIFASNDFKELPKSDVSSADVFADPDNHVFTLKINDRIGDPRWFPVEE